MRFLAGLFVVALLMTAVPVVAAPVPWIGFDDVPPSSMFFDDIMWLHDSGITRGCNPPENSLFCPSDFVTRGEMAAFLVRALRLTDPGGGDWFVDDDTSVFEGDIDRLAAAGVTKGCDPPDNDRFCPDQRVTRAQMASFLVRAYKLDAGAGLDWFIDDDVSVHQSDVDRLRTAWVTFGCNPPTESRFCPDSNVTREQMAAFIHRVSTQPMAGAVIGVHGSTWPETLYEYDAMVATFEVRNQGEESLHGLTAGPYDPEDEGVFWGDCDPKEITGPRERFGNGDASFDRGELWQWYCGQPTYSLWGSMYIEVTALDPGGGLVKNVGKVEYRSLPPIAVEVEASKTEVEQGEQVTWTIRISNPSGLHCVEVHVQARENGNGSYTDFPSPGIEVSGNGDAIFAPGEIWQYEYATTLWTSTFLEVTGDYAPAWSSGSHTGFGYVMTDLVRVIAP